MIAGTFAHFVYAWTGENRLVGFFVPVSESVWEHMKLVFFPMLLYSLPMVCKLRKEYPCISSAAAFGVTAGTLLIPIIFYIYTGVLGYNLFVLDLITFAVSVLTAFYLVYRLSRSCRLREEAALLWGAVALLMISFFVFTYAPPDIGIFMENTR